jgi:hypothetical protein
MTGHPNGDNHVDTTVTRLQPGDIVDITIKGVRIVKERPDGTVVISCEDDKVHGVWPMPPQAAITRPGAHAIQPISDDTDSRIADVLAFLDSLEAETSLQPYVAAGVRKALGLPPRHWPPQPGDVWDDGMPFGGSLWFARRLQADGPGWSETAIVMTSIEADRVTRSPEELLESAPGFPELTLVYRHKDGSR